MLTSGRSGRVPWWRIPPWEMRFWTVSCAAPIASNPRGRACANVTPSAATPIRTPDETHRKVRCHNRQRQRSIMTADPSSRSSKVATRRRSQSTGIRTNHQVDGGAQEVCLCGSGCLTQLSDFCQKVGNDAGKNLGRRHRDPANEALERQYQAAARTVSADEPPGERIPRRMKNPASWPITRPRPRVEHESWMFLSKE